MKRLLFTAGLLLLVAFSRAQESSSKLFDHLDASFTLGSTGLGFDFAMPAGDYLRVRTGATFMPRFEYKMKFNVELLGNPSSTATLEPGKTQAEINREHFEKLRELLQGFTGNDVSDHVDMLGRPTFHNFKFLVDVFPFKNNKKWHATVGFYAGGKRVAKAYNTYEATVSLFSVKMYNDMYWRSKNNEPIIDEFEFDPHIKRKFAEYGSMAMTVGYFKEDYYATQDILWDHNVWEDDMDENSPTYLESVLVHEKGDVRFHKGELAYHKGDAYRMLPGEDNMVKVDAYANKFRPYLGLGYNGNLSKDGRTQISVDAGAMFWGGVPDVYTHDGINLTKDLTRLNGQVRRYVNIASKFKCYPVLELRFSQRIF